MNTSVRTISATCLVLAGGLAFSWDLATAQQEYEMIMEEVIVVAPRIFRRERVGRTASGGAIERIALTRRVSYDDLDLKMYADVMKLERRVSEMAREACEQIDELFPLASLEPSTAECTRRAFDGAMVQVLEAVAAAQ